MQKWQRMRRCGRTRDGDNNYNFSVMKNILWLLLFTGLLPPGALHAQQRVVTGIVKDVNGPLPGATVVEKGLRSNGAITDREGRFRITLKGASNTLVITSISYFTQEVEVKEAFQEVTMQPNSQGLDQVVVVGFGTTKRITNTGAVSSIKGDEIRNIPTANVQNALSGRVPGFFSQQRSGQPGRDASDFFIRGVNSLNPDGNKALIIVDDIEYTYEQLSQINVNEIQSVSILKDASTTAIYGIKGANGVLVVTTRRGAMGAPKVNVRVESGMQSPVTKPRFLDSYHAAMLVNEAYRNDGLPLQFTEQDLELFRNGHDPYGHPNVNWYDVVFRPYSLQANTNIDISGGNETVKYFISGGALTQKGGLRDFSTPESDVNSNYFFRRYNFRTNLDIQATKTLKLRLDITGRFGTINEPKNANIVSEIYDFGKIRPYAAPVLNPDGSFAYAYGPGLSGLPTINARLSTQGYRRTSRTDLNILLGATQQLDAVTKGLSFQFRIAYASTADIIRSLTRFGDPPSYHYDPVTGTYTLDKRGLYRLEKFDLQSGNGIYDKKLNVQAFLNYDRTYGPHHVHALALFNRNSYTFKEQVPQNFLGYTGKVEYDFKGKYLLDFNAGYNGSDRFSKTDRFGFFPAMGLGWNLSEEPFFKAAFPFIQLFKLRGSYGLVGSDAVPDNRYLYEQVYNRMTSSYSFGDSHQGAFGIQEGALGNPYVTWEKERKADIGIDINMFRDRLSLTVDYFHNVRSDQLFYPGSVPGILGVGLARENLARTLNRGWDGQIVYRDKAGGVQYDITGVFSFARNKVLFQDEVSPAYPWLARTGLPIDQPFGYTCIGYYSDESDVAKSAKPLVESIKPGDLKYKDLNGDGIIDERDMGPVGKPNLPNTSLGLTLGIHYKGFDANVLFQSSFNYSLRVQGLGIEPFLSQMQPVHLQRWTPENGDHAQFPRLTTNTTSGVSSSSAYPSSFWYVDVQYVRLKTVELGYQLPSKWLPLKMNNGRVYLSCYNLVTWKNYSLYQQDPEIASSTAGDAYLNQRVVNLGVQVGL